MILISWSPVTHPRRQPLIQTRLRPKLDICKVYFSPIFKTPDKSFIRDQGRFIPDTTCKSFFVKFFRHQKLTSDLSTRKYIFLTFFLGS